MAPAFAAVRLWTSGRVWSLQQSLLGRGSEYCYRPPGDHPGWPGSAGRLAATVTNCEPRQGHRSVGLNARTRSMMPALRCSRRSTVKPAATISGYGCRV
jgi:hypothetical protein